MNAFFSIPKPCSENWNEMDATAKGAFCSKCTKEVIDCTTIKTSEIMGEIAAEKEPCVRIFADQIDEMNFLEWFKSLTIKIQLKYAFLFAFLIVFNTNVKAQDTITQPIINATPHLVKDDSCHQENYYWDSKDSLQSEFEKQDTLISEADTNNIAVSTDTVLQEILPSDDLEEEPSAELEGLVIDGEAVIWEPWMGDVAVCLPTTGFAVYGDWIETKPQEFNIPFLSNTNESLDLITNSNELSLYNSRFSFYIEGDSLRFMSYAVEPERIRIKITKKGAVTPIYFNPIQIDRGKSEILFPLNDFDNGAYIVTVEGESETKAIELIYW